MSACRAKRKAWPRRSSTSAGVRPAEGDHVPAEHRRRHQADQDDPVEVADQRCDDLGRAEPQAVGADPSRPVAKPRPPGTDRAERVVGHPAEQRHPGEDHAERRPFRIEADREPPSAQQEEVGERRGIKGQVVGQVVAADEEHRSQRHGHEVDDGKADADQGERLHLRAVAGDRSGHVEEARHGRDQGQREAEHEAGEGDGVGGALVRAQVIDQRRRQPEAEHHGEQLRPDDHGGEFAPALGP